MKHTKMRFGKMPVANFLRQTLALSLSLGILVSASVIERSVAAGKSPPSSLPSLSSSSSSSSLPSSASSPKSSPQSAAENNIANATPSAIEAGNAQDPEVAKWCKDVQHEVKLFKWKIDVCKDIHWNVGGKSVQGRPLVYADFGKVDAPNVTLIFSTVHGDEITPLYIGLQVAHWVNDHPKELANNRVIVAPLVNPDGFFSKPRRRTNAQGVDCNRNFLTKDWQAAALRSWKIRFHGDPRRNPGNEPHSEPETLFQEDLIRKINPQKILSIHSPLNHLDYDGPSALSLNRFSQDYVQECLKLRKRMRATTTGFFPGSLGNYAGQELGIPTLTLELPTANPAMADAYWKKYSEGIELMVEFSVPPFTSS